MKVEKAKLDKIMDEAFLDEYEAIIQMHKMICLLIYEVQEMKDLLEEYGIFK